MYGKPDYDLLADAWRCEICGEWFKGLGYHIARHHGITVREYNKRFGFDLSNTYLAKQYKRKKRKAILKTGMYKNLAKGKKHRYTKNKGPKNPKYKRSEQTKQRLKTLRKKNK
jgi:predicted transcriptional regulator